MLLDTPGSATFNQRETGVAAVRGQCAVLLADASGAVLVRFRVLSKTPLLTLTRQWASANLVAVVFDVSSRDSLQSCAKWLRRFLDSRAGSTAGAAAGVARGAIRGVVRTPFPPPGSVPAAAPTLPLPLRLPPPLPRLQLIGSKADLREEERAEVSPAEAKAFADSAGLAYFDVSAVRGRGGRAGEDRPSLPTACRLPLQELPGAGLDAPFEHLGRLFLRSFAAELELAADL